MEENVKHIPIRGEYYSDKKSYYKMNFLISNLRLRSLLILFWTIYVEENLASKDYPRTLACSTHYKPSKEIENFYFQCSIVMPYDINDRFLNCINYDNRSIRVKEFTIVPHEMSILCTSNSPITVDVKFADGIVFKSYLNMKWSRKVVDFDDVTTYTYNLEIFPSQLTESTYKRDDAVKYTFSSVQFPSETIDVLYISEKHPSIHELNYIVWMEDKRDIKLEWTPKTDGIFIPCVSRYAIEMRKIGNLNSTVLKYNATPFGLFLFPFGNIVDLLGQYECFRPGYAFSVLEFNIVPQTLDYTTGYNIHFTENRALQSKFAFVSELKFSRQNKTIFQQEGFDFELKCQAKYPYIRFSPDESGNSTICNSTHHTTIDPVSNQTFTTVACIISNLNNDSERESLPYYACIDENNEVPLFRWYLWSDRFYHYDLNKQELRCLIINLSMDDINLQQEMCYNPLTCKLVLKSLQNFKCGSPLSYCSASSFVSPCATMKILHKAVFMCNSIDTIDSESSDKLSFSYSNIHYVGFDEILYYGIQSNPPKNAILKMVNLGPTEQTMINLRPVKFSFYCEAHSFFFEEGIQWLFQYINDTTHLIPADFISQYVPDIPKKYEEYANPSSSVNILVPDKNIRKIRCAAPRLSILKMNNYKEWEFQEMTISIYDAIAPTFLDTESKISFIVGQKNKEIKCQAFGLPKPVIQWTALSGQNSSTYDIIDLSLYSVLKFPTYTSTNEGEYMCTVINEIGNISKTFSVSTASTFPMEQFAFLVTGIMVVLVLSLTVTFYWFFRKMKMKQSMEMNSILQLLHGRAPNTNDNNSSNPLQIAYDRKWELDKHSFCIDESKILGCGEFGIVYKGTIAKLNCSVAFKSLKSQGSMSHLKSLVSELKLLIYVNGHVNIVECFGAYTEEIKKGIIYVALEFCALGSLESHLRSYKSSFLKCPFLTLHFEDANAQITSPSRESTSSTYSLKSLLKWCSEISHAMDYLYSKKVVHRDLATRNVLLTADWAAKLTDFGLSRRTYTSDEYVKLGQDPLPWRWLALESFLTKTFNVKTDVWAFGITLWEIFSLGETPYPGISANMEFVAELEKGLRNQKPKYASKELYEVMSACWNCEADERPSFASLCILFHNSLQHPIFQVDVEDMKVYGQCEGRDIEYMELLEL